MPQTPPITAILLAGGAGRRMGGEDKGLLKLKGKSLAEWVLARIAPQVDEILISATSRKDQGVAMSVKPIDIVVAGEKEATLKIDKSGRLVVTLMKPISSKKRTQLVRLIQDFFEQETK